MSFFAQYADDAHRCALMRIRCASADASAWPTLARRAKRVAEGHQLEIRAQRAPRFLVFYILYFIFSIEYWILSITKKIVIKFTILILRLDPLNQIYKQQHLNVNEMVGYRVPFDNMILVIDFSCFVL